MRRSLPHRLLEQVAGAEQHRVNVRIAVENANREAGRVESVVVEFGVVEVEFSAENPVPRPLVFNAAADRIAAIPVRKAVRRANLRGTIFLVNAGPATFDIEQPLRQRIPKTSRHGGNIIYLQRLRGIHADRGFRKVGAIERSLDAENPGAPLSL